MKDSVCQCRSVKERVGKGTVGNSRMGDSGGQCTTVLNSVGQCWAVLNSVGPHRTV